MNRFMVLVDAGYLFHKGVEILSNNATKNRRFLELVDPPGLVRLLIDESKAALEISEQQLLRVYWYDGVMPGGLTAQQNSILMLPDLTFRAGLVNSIGKQKGVDSSIHHDLLELASSRTVADAALVTGDSDLVIGMEAAQRKGVRIAVIGLEDSALGVGSGQSREITNLADRVRNVDRPALEAVMRYVPIAPMSNDAAASMRTDNHWRKPPAISPNRRGLTSSELASVVAAVEGFIVAKAPVVKVKVVDGRTKRLDATIDRDLLRHVCGALSVRRLTEAQKAHARRCFIQRLSA